MQTAIKSITVRGNKGEYRFEISWDERSQKYIATCDQPNGGLSTAGTGREILLLMVECVRTWETV